MHNLINLKKYPIGQLSPKLDTIFNQINIDLEKDGCAIVKDFLTNLGIKELTKEADDIVHHAHHYQNHTHSGSFSKDQMLSFLQIIYQNRCLEADF